MASPLEMHSKFKLDLLGQMGRIGKKMINGYFKFCYVAIYHG